MSCDIMRELVCARCGELKELDDEPLCWDCFVETKPEREWIWENEVTRWPEGAEL